MTPDDIFGTQTESHPSKKDTQRIANAAKTHSNKKNNTKEKIARNDDAPIWLYIVSLIVLFVILGIIFTRMGLF